MRALAVDDIAERMADLYRPSRVLIEEGLFLSRDELRLAALQRLPSARAASGGRRRTQATAVRLKTVAPEPDGVLPLIAFSRPGGERQRRSATWRASYEEVGEACKVGAEPVNHLFNGMPSLYHRLPGAAWRALVDEPRALGLIADGFHVDRRVPAFVVLFARDRVVLVTDAEPRGGRAALYGSTRLAVIEGTPEGTS